MSDSTTLTKIYRATIKRSGAGMVVRGFDADGRATRATNVQTIVMTDAGPLATDGDGAVFQLMPVL